MALGKQAEALRPKFSVPLGLFVFFLNLNCTFMTSTTRSVLNRRHFLQTASALAPATPLGLLFAPNYSHAQIVSLPDAIEKAEALFMLSQRAAKAYFAIGLDVRKQEAQKALDSSVQRFDRLLIEQKAFTSTAAVTKTYTDLGTAWVQLKIELIGKVPNKAGAANIMTLNKAVFELSSLGANQLQTAAKTPNSKLQDVAGSVRMLSQQLSKNYFRKNWGIAAEGAATELPGIAKSYLEGKAFLLAAPQTSASVKQKLNLVNDQWAFVESAINSKRPATPANYSDVWGASENILTAMDEICMAYFKLG